MTLTSLGVVRFAGVLDWDLWRRTWALGVVGGGGMALLLLLLLAPPQLCPGMPNVRELMLKKYIRCDVTKREREQEQRKRLADFCTLTKQKSCDAAGP